MERKKGTPSGGDDSINTSSTTDNTIKVYNIDNIDIIKELSTIFRPIRITPSTTIQEIMYNSGQLSVLDKLTSILSTRTISSKLQDTIKPRSFINKFLGR